VVEMTAVAVVFGSVTDGGAAIFASCMVANTGSVVMVSGMAIDRTDALGAVADTGVEVIVGRVTKGAVVVISSDGIKVVVERTTEGAIVEGFGAVPDTNSVEAVVGKVNEGIVDVSGTVADTRGVKMTSGTTTEGAIIEVSMIVGVFAIRSSGVRVIDVAGPGSGVLEVSKWEDADASAILSLLIELMMGDIAVSRMHLPGKAEEVLAIALPASVDPASSASAADARMRRGREDIGASPMTLDLISVLLGVDAGKSEISGIGDPSTLFVATCEAISVSIVSTEVKTAPKM
jgi:hypothetical protein